MMRVGMSWLDVTLGVRMLARYPGLSLIGGLAITVAIAIGAAYFEFVNDIARPTLPLDEGDRVVAIQNFDVAASAPEGRSLHDFVTWRDGLRSVDDVGAFITVPRNLITADGRTELVEMAEISASAFRLTRVPPLLGRPLLEADERDGAPPVVVIGHGVWQTRFGGDPGIVGRSVRLGSTTATIVGVMPEGYAFPIRQGLWAPLRLKPSDYARLAGPRIRVFGRLAPGATREEAQAELAAIGRRAAADFPATHAKLRPRILPYAESFIGEDGTLMYWLNALFVMLLVVACANVATLVFARTATREAEIAVRSALGASRRRIVLQLFAEALVLAAAAAVAGLAAAAWAMRWGTEAVWSAQGGLGAPFWIDPGLSPATVLYAAALVVLAALIAGVVPALRATRGQAQTTLQRLGVGGASMRMGGAWTAMIVAQVALSVAFLPTAVSEGWDAFRSRAAGAGFPAGEYLTVRLAVDAETPPTASAGAYEARLAARAAATHRELERRLEAEPGVAAVTFADRLPGMEHPERRIEVDGPASPSIEETAREARVAGVAMDFFDALGAPILAGRGFHSGDLASGAGVVVVNQSFARMHFGGASPVGRRVRYAAVKDEAPGAWHEIVGVVRDLGMNPDPQGEGAGIYHPLAPGGAQPVRMAVRAGPDAASFAPRLRAAAAAVDPTLRLYELRTLDDLARAEQTGYRVFAAVLALLAAIVLLLSTAGIYSLMSLTVAQRTREIGIRAALGAHPRRILAAIFSRAIRQLAIGVAAGGSAAVLFGVLGPGDQIAREGPWLLIAVSAFMLLVGLAACVVPAVRGLRIQPTEALRSGG